jgi:MFS family permease
MQRVVTGWLTWELTGSGAWLGLVVFADLFPTVIVGPIAGAYADRSDRLRVTKISQALAMLQAVALFLLTATGLINIGLLLALTLFLGVVAAFNQPARLALIPALVPRSDLTAAVAVNSVVFNLARFIGPAVAGLIIATVGVSVAYAANAATFIAFLVALSKVRLNVSEALPQGRGKLWSDLIAGIRYSASHVGIATVLTLMIAANVGARPLLELLPGFAADVFHSGAAGLALLTSSVGAGAIIAGFWLAGMSGGTSLGRAFLANTLISALAGVLFAMTDNMWLAVPLLVVNGFAMAGMGIAAQTLIQIAVDPGMRGRVLSLHGLIFRGGPALGALIMGTASDLVGLRLPIFLGATVVLAVWIWARLRQSRMTESLGGQ